MAPRLRHLLLTLLGVAACALGAAGIASADPSPDGSGDLVYTGIPVANGSTSNELDFVFDLSSADFQNGALEITVPSGWSQPSVTSSDPGYTTSTCGTVATLNNVITITGITLANSFCDVFYGDLTGPGTTAPAIGGPSTFQASSKSTPGGTLTPLAGPAEVQVLAPDGSGTMGADTSSVPNGSPGNTIKFRYTSALGGMFFGLVTMAVPAGWSAPDDSDPHAPGFTTIDVGCGCLTVIGRTIFVPGAILGVFGVPDHFRITYGDNSQGGPGAQAPTTPGPYDWRAASQASCDCDSVLKNLAASPKITVLSPDGAGNVKAAPSAVSAGSRNTLTFKYAPGAGGMSNGTVSLDVPAGWSAPTTTAGQDGYVTASAGTVSTVGQTITVSGLTLFGRSMTITYGSTAGGGSGALAPATVGPSTWTAMERSSAVGTLTPLGSSPQVTVNAPDGSGTLTTPTVSVQRGSSGNTVQFTYTAAPGGTANGAVRLTVPPGWSPPSTNSSDAGYTTAGSGTVAVSGRKITVSGITLAAAGTTTITYGAGSGAAAPGSAGQSTWSAWERSTHAGSLTPIATSPVIAVL